MTRERTTAITLGKLFGIPVRMHWSFPLFLVWIGISGFNEERGALYEVVFALSIFLCVVLHEFGHALMARIFSVRTRDITLYPIGGVAMLEREARPRQELLIALAGPAVNLLIAFMLVPFVSQIFQSPPTSLDGELPTFSFADRLFMTNLVLVIFNMIPAFPMDGGRVLRASLALILGEHRASLIAARVGQALSLLLGLFGLFSGNPMLMFVGLFVFLGATQEHFIQSARGVVAGRKVKDLMLPIGKLETLNHGSTVRQAAEVCIRALQEDFPVVLGSAVSGVVSKEAIFREMTGQSEDVYIAGIMERDYLRGAPDDDLGAVIERLRAGGGGPLLVFQNDQLVGMVTRSKLVELLVVLGSTPTARVAHAES